MPFYAYKDTSGEWRWHLTGDSNRIIAVSPESYKTKSDSVAAMSLVRQMSNHGPDEMALRPGQVVDSVADSLRKLSVFLCHSSGDKTDVRLLYGTLHLFKTDPWLDEEKLLPGQDWNKEIKKAVRNSDVVLVCLSRKSINKTGYVQKEISLALDVSDEQSEDAIFLIPLRLEECDIPERLQRWHWVNLFDQDGYDKLLNALCFRARQLGRIVPSDGRPIRSIPLLVEGKAGPKPELSFEVGEILGEIKDEILRALAAHERSCEKYALRDALGFRRFKKQQPSLDEVTLDFHLHELEKERYISVEWTRHSGDDVFSLTQLGRKYVIDHGLNKSDESADHTR